MRDCRTCLGPHDEETHAATLRVRAWLKTEACPPSYVSSSVTVKKPRIVEQADRFGDIRIGKRRRR